MLVLDNLSEIPSLLSDSSFRRIKPATRKVVRDAEILAIWATLLFGEERTNRPVSCLKPSLNKLTTRLAARLQQHSKRKNSSTGGALPGGKVDNVPYKRQTCREAGTQNHGPLHVGRGSRVTERRSTSSSYPSPRVRQQRDWEPLRLAANLRSASPQGKGPGVPLTPQSVRP
jgi:hypothetical protein